MTALQHFDLLQANAVTLFAVLALLLLAGLLAATRNASVYVVAGRSVPASIAGMATSSAFVSTAPFLALAGTLFALGSDGLSWLLGLAAGLVLMGVLIAPAFRAAGATTVPQLLAQRFGHGAVPLLATLIVTTCGFVLLLAQFIAVGIISETALGLPAAPAIFATAIAIAAVLAAGGMRAATWLGAALLVVVLVAYLAPLAVVAIGKHGLPFAHVIYGQSLQEVQKLEIDMLTEGLADARTLKPHLRPFLQVDHLNTLALIVCLAAGTAVLPHVLMRNAVTAGVRQTRMAMAWTLLFTAAILAAAPAYAALTKHELYGYITKGVPLSELPQLFADEDIAVHGVPLSLYGAVIDTTRGETPDAAEVGRRLQNKWPDAFAAWRPLKPQVKGALVEAAKGMGDSAFEQRVDSWRTKVLPVAATAAGNKTGKLTHGAVGIDANRATVFAFKLAGLSPLWIAIFGIGGILAGLGTALATAWLVARAIAHDLRLAVTPDAGGGTPSTWGTRVAVVAVTLAAAALALDQPAGVVELSGWTISLLAAGLFPVLVLGIWWRRATAAGAVAGMIAGVAVTLAYIGGSHFAPVPFLQATAALSDAGPPAGKRAADLAAVADKASPEAKPAAEAAFEAYVRGTPPAPGAANWFGIHNTAAAVFGLPVAFLFIILVSLLTRRPATADTFFEAIRRPAAVSPADR